MALLVNGGLAGHQIIRRWAEEQAPGRNPKPIRKLTIIMMIKSAPPCPFGCGSQEVVQDPLDWVCPKCDAARFDLDPPIKFCPTCKTEFDHRHSKGRQFFVAGKRWIIARVSYCDCNSGGYKAQTGEKITLSN
ncbi:MAG: hypothetical protein ABI612_06120 [Betaproteobacteria bacterium]